MSLTEKFKSIFRKTVALAATFLGLAPAIASAQEITVVPPQEYRSSVMVDVANERCVFTTPEGHKATVTSEDVRFELDKVIVSVTWTGRFDALSPHTFTSYQKQSFRIAANGVQGKTGGLRSSCTRHRLDLMQLQKR